MIDVFTYFRILLQFHRDINIESSNFLLLGVIDMHCGVKNVGLHTVVIVNQILKTGFL